MDSPSSKAWMQNPLPEPDWGPLLTAPDVEDALKTRSITIIAGRNHDIAQYPEGVLQRITYFANCLRHDFKESRTGAFTLNKANFECVCQLLTWTMRRPEKFEVTGWALVAKYADMWQLPRFAQTCMSAFWKYLTSHGRNETKTEELLSHWYHVHRDHRMRYMVIHFLVCRKRLGGLPMPENVAKDLDLVSEFAKWDSVLERACIRAADDNEEFRGHILLRRLLDGSFDVEGVTEGVQLWHLRSWRRLVGGLSEPIGGGTGVGQGPCCC